MGFLGQTSPMPPQLNPSDDTGEPVDAARPVVDGPFGPVPADTWPAVDRRQTPTSPFSRHVWFGGRRRSNAHPMEVEGSFVDQHGPGLFLAVLVVLLLNVLDALFTVYFLSYGGRELNPIMDWVLKFGVMPFLMVKTVGIGVGVVLLALAKNFRAARFGLGFVMVGYTLLFGWHILLYSWLHW